MTLVYHLGVAPVDGAKRCPETQPRAGRDGRVARRYELNVTLHPHTGDIGASVSRDKARLVKPQTAENNTHTHTHVKANKPWITYQ